MRRELFKRGVIAPKDFEAEVREKAIRSQAREGLHNPFAEETAEIWETRLDRIRTHLTDFYFAYNLPYDLFEDIVRQVLSEREMRGEDISVSFNPELAPQEMLFEHGLTLEKLPAEERLKYEHRLQEIKVVLIRRMISDQLAYINIAKDWFMVADLRQIQHRKIGYGKIGGKSAGMLLAARILSEVADDEIRSCLNIPESFFLGSDVMYDFMNLNQLMHWSDQKYKTEEQIRSDFAQLSMEYQTGDFPADILERLKELMEGVGSKPVIVRSSSLLEDNFGFSFAGKYESVFCPNQGTAEQNLRALTRAIAQVYASGLNPDALLYRRSMGLQDYDERLAILIQVVEGEQYGYYFLPHAAGVGFSRNLYRWSPQIEREAGFLRLVWGLGTRAVDRVGNDYPRLVALSHPALLPESSPKAIRRYSQQYVDLLNLESNHFETLPTHEVLDSRYPVLRYLAQLDKGGYLTPIRSALIDTQDAGELVLTFDGLLRRTFLPERMRRILNMLEKHYRLPVDMEFTLHIPNPRARQPDVHITILQCRPQSHTKGSEANLPDDLRSEDIVFSTTRMVPQGRIRGIRYVVFVTPQGYYALPTQAERAELGRAIGRLNALLAEETFICIGPGRWGTSNPDLGVNIGYADVYNTRALIELSGKEIGSEPELSFGTHFFQDLVEANIYPLGINLDDDDVIFNRDFFYYTPNRLSDWSPKEAGLEGCLRLIEVSSYRPEHHLELVMDDEAGQAAAFLKSSSAWDKKG
jgi:hypothetical protein